MRYSSIIAMLLFSTAAFAGEVAVPNIFVAGEKALAEEVNENFSSLADGVNDNDARIDTNIIDIEANSTALATKQNRVSACDPGTSIRVINENGSVVCELDDVGTIGTGDITSVVAGSGLNGGAETGEAVLSVDTSVIQQKLSNSVCPAGQYVASIADNGAVTCSTPPTSSGDITAVNTLVGSGLSGGAASGDVTLAVDTNVVQQKLSGSACAGIAYVKSIDEIGATVCGIPPQGDITSVSPGTGLSDGGASGDVTLNIDFTKVQGVVQGVCSDGRSAIRSINPDGNVTCQPISNNGFTAGCGSTCNSTVTGDESTININSISVSTNAASGRILVHFNGSIECRGTLGDYVYVTTQIKESASGEPTNTGDGSAMLRMSLTDSRYQTHPINLVRSFPVAVSGTYTFYANAKNVGTTSIGCRFFGGNMEAIYIP